MPKAKPKINPHTDKKFNIKPNRKQEILLGGFLLVFGLALLIAFTAFWFTWENDQSIIGHFGERSLEAQNLLSKLGAHLSHFFVYNGFGVAAYIPALLILWSGLILFLNLKKNKLIDKWFWGLYIMLCLSLIFSLLPNPILGGKIGYELNLFLQDYIGLLGVLLLIFLLSILFLVYKLNFKPEAVVAKFKNFVEKKAAEDSENQATSYTDGESDFVNVIEEVDKKESVNTDNNSSEESNPTVDLELKQNETTASNTKQIKNESDEDIEVEIAEVEEDEVELKSKQLVEDFGSFDPTLELSSFKFPDIELLKDYTAGKSITIDEDELQANKKKIVDTLSNYNIGIAHIKATIGPTVTLYEIVPEAGIRISKIKNLEDDIALSLSALGIRIIAPMPGKGTIGIEVPNQKPAIVSMRSVISSKKFQDAEMQLPIAIGKNISNETFVFDLAKMPHLLMAGATGQGKSVGLNAILASLLYKKHPAEVKFVLVDPKKVELTLYNKIERHYLAKLPDTEEAIITDNTKVINTLNSLCIEMDNRYELLKNAMCRNIAEYNAKFKSRKLNPNEGHKFLPYIVLVVDEFADLIMTAGKEVETPIARLAQLARAIGIHLIIATQRPSVNVITGIIKANFPARIAFRVTSKIDSRTILDSGGADQLIGRGDMLFTSGNDLVRLQCAFIDTPEVELLTDFIGNQRAYPNAFELPEYVGEESGTNLDVDASDRDALFREAAEVIVTAQQGSASLLQRKLKLGYNRAGRIIDQLEAAGIVGPFEGSKARQVLVQDINALNQLLDNENL